MSREKYPHYYKFCPYEYIDVYRVLELFGVTDQAIGHAIKKLLAAGNRGQKNFEKDISEAIDTLNRKLEMMKEEHVDLLKGNYVDNKQDRYYTEFGPTDSFGPLPEPVKNLPILTEEETDKIFDYIKRVFGGKYEIK